MTNLSVIIITKNEQHYIKECIQSVAQVANEVIVLDSQSNDQTVDLAQSLGARVCINNDWLGFGVQKNRALSLATGDWVLSIDADERLSHELAQEIKVLLNQEPKYNSYSFKRLSWYCGRLIKFSGWQDDYVIRLFKRGYAVFTNDLVHERLVSSEINKGNLISGQLHSSLMHYSYSDFDQVLGKVNRYSSLWAEQKFKEGKTSSFRNAIFHGLAAFVKTYLLKKGFLDGVHGLALALSNAEGAYYKYLKLWHLQLTKQKSSTHGESSSHSY
jgi:glycosyltransferase involved in cell wall biosynthesis